MAIELSKDSDKFLCIIYKDFLQRRKNGESKAEAKRFTTDYLESFVPLYQWHPQDISEARMELGKKHLIKNWIGTGFYIEDDGIIYMENRFKNSLKEVADFINKFIP